MAINLMAPNWIWEVNLPEFLLVTVALGGGAAWLTGRACALSWLPRYQLAWYVLLLTCATRFIHYALFSGTLLTGWYFLVDFLVVLAIGFYARRYTRARQMARQYPFLFERRGVSGWGRRR